MQPLLCRQAHGLSFDGASVHGQIAQVRQQLLRTVLGLNELEKLWRVIDELGWGVNQYSCLDSGNNRSLSSRSFLQ
jgi:hypothetical protein